MLSIIPKCHEMSTFESNVVRKGNDQLRFSIGTKLKRLFPNTRVSVRVIESVSKSFRSPLYILTRTYIIDGGINDT